MPFPIETPLQKDLLPALARVVATIAKSATTREHPYFVHTLGIPGSGKSSFVNALADQMKDRPPTVVAFDRLMEQVPEYRTHQDREQAFKQYELPAREAGYLLLRRLIEKGADILLDHSGAFPKHVDMLRYAKEAKHYRVIIVRIMVDLETAKKRIAIRQSIEGRHTPLDYVDERNRIVTELLPAYRDVADVYAEISNEREAGASPQALVEETAKIAIAVLNAVRAQ